MIKRITVFLICALVAAGLWWISGYNFDTRSPAVMAWTGITAFWCAAITALITD